MARKPATKSLMILALALAASTTAPAQTVELRFNQKGGWVFTRSGDPSSAALRFPDAPDRRVRLRLREIQDGRKTLSEVRSRIISTAPMPRFNADAAEIEKALVLARAWVDRLPSGEDSSRFIGQHAAEFQSVWRIFAIAGTSKDAQKLVEYCQREHSYQRGIAGSFLPIVAYIEKRLGNLESGELNSLLAGPEGTIRSHAAVLLKAYGIRKGESIIIAAFQNPRVSGCSPETLLSVMLDRPHPQVLSAVRRQLDESITRWRESAPNRAKNEPHYQDQVSLPENALSYLLVYGDMSDVEVLAGLPLNPDLSGELISVVEDPNQLLPVSSSAKTEHTFPYFVTRHAHRLWTHRPVVRRRFLNRAFGLAYQHRLASIEGKFPEDVARVIARMSLRSTLSSKVSFIAPPEELGSFGERFDHGTIGIEWASPSSQYASPLIQYALTRKAFQADGTWFQGTVSQAICKLDHFSAATFDKALERVEAPREAKKLMAAAHRVADGAFSSSSDSHDGETMSRPYWFNVPQHGMLSGIVSVTPDRRGNSLTFRVAVDQRVFIARTLIDAGPASSFPLGKLTLDHGRKLLKSARLIRGDGSVIQLELDGPNNNGEFSTGRVDADSLGGAYLAIEFDLPQRSRVLAFDLFRKAF